MPNFPHLAERLVEKWIQQYEITTIIGVHSEASGLPLIEAITTALGTVQAEEREACAKVAEQFEPDEKSSSVQYASTAIRGRTDG